MTTGKLDAVGLAKLTTSGLDRRNAKQLEIYSVSARTAESMGHESRAGIVIPYHDIEGRRVVGMYRLRYLEAPVGFRALAQDQPKYVQPAGQRPMPYFPRLIDWKAVADDATKSLILTEGELKAAKATRDGFPTIGLGGVASWRTAKQGIAFLPELDDINWLERLVYIAYDSDLMEKPNVAREARLLGDELHARGAQVHLATLPGAGDAKVGLDDFLVAKSPAELRKVLASAERYPQSSTLWEMNERFCYVRGEVNMVYDQSDDVFVKGYLFHERHANWLPIVETVETRRGTSTTKTPASHAWIKWPHRREAAGVAFAPGDTHPITQDGRLNLWHGLAVEPRPGNVKPWHQFLQYFFGGNAEKIRFFESWVAFPLQHPGAKLLSACFFWGRQGAGKTFMGDVVRGLYGRHGYQASVQDLDRWTSWLRDKAFVVGNELAGGDRRAHAEMIKTWITDPTIRTEAKGENAIVVDNHVNFMFNSNEPSAVLVSQDDRRFFVHQAPTPTADDEAFMTGPFRDWVFSSDGPAALLHYLLALDLKSFNPRARPPETTDKAYVRETSRTDVQDWLHHIREGEEKPRSLGGRDLVTATELRVAYEASGVSNRPIGASTMGVEAGRILTRLRVVGQSSSIYAVAHGDVYLRIGPAALARELAFQRENTHRSEEAEGWIAGKKPRRKGARRPKSNEPKKPRSRRGR